MDGFDPRVQTTAMLASAVRSALAFGTVEPSLLNTSGLAESLQVLITVAVIDSGAEAEPAMVDRGDPNMAAINVRTEANCRACFSTPMRVPLLPSI
jgi:hypothetical protein